MLKSIEMSNFRSFKHIQMDDLPRICLLSGKNSVGKSTILEAIFFFYCSHMNTMLMQAQITRARPLLPDNFLPSLFHAYDVDHEAVLQFTDESSVYTNHYMFSKGESLHQLPSNSQIPKMIIQGPPSINNIPQMAIPNMNELIPVSSLIIKKQYQPTSLTGDENNDKTSQLFNYEGFPISTLVGDNSQPSKHAFFLTASENRSADASPLSPESLFSMLQDQRREQEAIDTIKKIVPSILSIRVSVKNNQPMLMCYVDGSSQDIPLSHMGDGVVRSFSMILQTLTTKSDILLIDEIENGVHYSVLHVLWDAIFANSEINKCQIFATTHSYECIKAAIKSYQNFADSNLYPSERNLFAFYRLENRGNDNVTAVRYGSGELAEVIDSDWEVR